MPKKKIEVKLEVLFDGEITQSFSGQITHQGQCSLHPDE